MRQNKASDSFVPNPAFLSSLGWDNIYLEFHQQPKFEIVEHQHTMHIIACAISPAPGERSLDGNRQKERRVLRDIIKMSELRTISKTLSTARRSSVLAGTNS